VSLNMRLRGTLLLDLQRPQDDLWRGLKKRRRGDVKRAMDLGVEITDKPSADHASHWGTLLEQRMEDIGKINLKVIEKGILFVAALDGELLSGEIFIPTVGRAGGAGFNLVYSATDKDKEHSSAAHALLVWETIKYAKEKGFDEYDFGGWNCYRLDNAGVNKWKEGFGGTIWWGIGEGQTPEEQLHEQMKAVLGGAIAKPEEAIIWFDDGHRSVYEFALRDFKRYGVKPIVAIVTGKVGENLDISNYDEYPLMDIDMLKALVKEGWEIASHGVTHTRLSELSLEEARREMVESKKWIKDNLDVEATKFAAPYDSLTTEQLEAAKEIYEYVRPRIPPRPPQPGGIHAIYHGVQIKMNSSKHYIAGIPPDLGWLNYVGAAFASSAKTAEISNPSKINFNAFNSLEAVEHYTEYYLSASEKNIFEAISPGRILDVGCGAGRTTRYLLEKGFDVVAIDIAPKMIDRARRLYPDGDFRVMDASNTDFKDGEFEYVLFSFNGLDCLHPFPRRIKCLREVNRILKLGGTFIYSSHNRAYIENHLEKNRPMGEGYYLHNSDYGPNAFYTTTGPEEEEEQLRQAGFALRKVYPGDVWNYYVAIKNGLPS